MPTDPPSTSWQAIELIGGIEKVPIHILPYDPDWPGLFESHAARLREALQDQAKRIEHIGSTSVPGLAAKPIIDLLLVVEDSADEGRYAGAIRSAGYELRLREPAFHEHRMFRTAARDVHVHVFSEHSPEIDRYLRFRDVLRDNAETREDYAALKRQLSTRDWAHMDEYAEAKTDFIETVIRRAR